MIYTIFHPSEALSKFIKYYWYMEDPIGNGNERDLLIPDLSSELIFNYDSLYHRYSIKQDNKEDIKMSCLIGQRNQSIFANRQSKTRLFGVKFKTGALYTLFGIPEKELNNKSVPINELGNSFIIELEDKILNQREIELIPAILDEYFTLKLASIDLNELNNFNHYLKGISNLADVTQLRGFRKTHDIHYKKLERLFTKYGGVSARNFIRINRFKNFYKAFNKENHSFYDSTIYELGYYDQNHFIKDFFFFTNQNPSQYYQKQSNLSDSILIQTLDLLKNKK